MYISGSSTRFLERRMYLVQLDDNFDAASDNDVRANGFSRTMQIPALSKYNQFY